MFKSGVGVADSIFSEASTVKVFRDFLISYFLVVARMPKTKDLSFPKWSPNDFLSASA